MDWPEARFVALFGVRGIGHAGEGCEGRGGGRVVGCEGNVILRVPVFGADFEVEGEGEEAINDGDYGAAGGDGEGAVLYCGGGLVLCREGERGEGRMRGAGLTGGQKSSWRSTTIRAGLKVVAMVLVGDWLTER